MVNFLKKKWIIISLIIAGTIAIGYFMFNQGDKPEYVLTEATKGDIIQTVSVTGSIIADPTIDLHFQKSGKVREILVKEGDIVEKDKLLASLENKTLELEIKRNKANVSYANANYNKTKAGYTSEEIQIAEAEVESAQASYNAAISDFNNTKSINETKIDLAEIAYKQAQDNADASLKDYKTTKALAEKEIAKIQLGGNNTQTVALDSAYVNARINLDIIMTSMQDSMFLAENILGIRGTKFELLTQNQVDRIKFNYFNTTEDDYEKAVSLYGSLTSTSTEEEIDNTMTATIKAASSILQLFTQIGNELQTLPYSNPTLENKILEVTTQSASLSSDLLSLKEVQTTILNIKTGSISDTETLILSYQLKIDSAQSTYNTALNSGNKAEIDLEQAKLNAQSSNDNAEANVTIKRATLNSANATLALKKAPVRAVDLAPLSAQISQAKIALQIAENDHKDSQLRAPINGLVTFIYGKVGENISLSETALSAFLSIQVDNLIVEANVPETDISKIKNGDKVEMTIDAFDFTEKFEGTVIYIDHAETIIQGVVYYQIKTAFDLDDEKLKSGMTTNLDIITAEKENVITIPARAIKYEDSTRYTEVLNNGEPKKTVITTGLESDQFVEVLSGLEEGDKIITFVK